MVFAPALITASKIRHRKSISERPASSAENSMSSVYCRAQPMALTACSTTWSGVMRSFFSMWIGEVAMKVWIRPDLAGLIASPARRMSFSLARASEQTVESLIACAIEWIESKSPGEAAAKPASITSTRIFSSCRATRIFSSLVIDAPGLCSPSRRVVSKITRCCFIFCSEIIKCLALDQAKRGQHIAGQAINDKESEQGNLGTVGDQRKAQRNRGKHEEWHALLQVDVLETVEADIGDHRHTGKNGQHASQPANIAARHASGDHHPDQSGDQLRSRRRRQALEVALVHHFQRCVETGQPQRRPRTVNERGDPAQATEV